MSEHPPLERDRTPHISNRQLSNSELRKSLTDSRRALKCRPQSEGRQGLVVLGFAGIHERPTKTRQSASLTGGTYRVGSPCPRSDRNLPRLRRPSDEGPRPPPPVPPPPRPAPRTPCG